MDKRALSGRQPTPGILKKPKHKPKGDFLDKSTKIKREKTNTSKKAEDVSAPLSHGCTPLMYACQQADYNTVDDILNKDPSSVVARDRGLRVALHYCASGAPASETARAAAAARVLMAAPTQAGARDADGLTPLHLAVVHGNVPLVQTLLAAGADVNATDDEHHTVVHWATVCGEVGALRAVLAAGADPAAPDQHGGCPLHYAAQMCGAPAATDHQSRGAALEVLRALVREGGARVDARDADGRTPLLWAASAGSAAAVLALHQAGARLDDADRDGLTALHCAAARGHTEAMETLIGLCGARVDVADGHGCTPLHYAAALGHADATATLLQHAADPHRQDRKGRSPAHTAAAKGQLETVRMLGARGANLWLRNSKGDLPLHEAVASGRRELVKWLLDGRPSQVNATNHEGRTPLHIAAATDNADLCRLLLDRGAEVNPVARSSKNEPITPLDCATTRGHRSTAKYLQMHGGLPASKLTDTHILIDGTAVTNLPTRRVTSTKIDVQDRITIKKREILEVSSPVQERRKFRGRRYESESSTDSDQRTKSRRGKVKHGSKNERRKMLESQKSFSDGYDSEHEKNEVYDYTKSTKSLKKSRSRSEPSKRSSSRSKYSRNRNRSFSGSDSDSNRRRHDEKKKHRKRSKKRSSYSSESSSSESSDRRSTKRKGKKTSIHIENDDEKQCVNIIKYKDTESKQGTEVNGNASDTRQEVPAQSENTEVSKESHLEKTKTLSETETDNISVKTNVVVTEAQIHMERDSSQHGSSEITVTVDAANNVSIETSNMSVSHVDKDEEQQMESVKEITDVASIQPETAAEGSAEKAVVETKVHGDTTKLEEANIGSTNADNIDASTDKGENIPEPKENKADVKVSEEATTDSAIPDTQVTTTDQTQAVGEQVRKRSFEVLSGPDLTDDSKLNEGDKTLQDKVETPSVSFAQTDNVIENNTTIKSPDHLMGQLVQPSDRPQTGKDTTASSDSIVVSSEDKRKEFTSTTASSGEISQSNEKGLVSVIDDDIPAEERAVQQVIVENVTDDIGMSPKRVRKSSKDSPSSRKSSIYETESYKVLSDIASAAETATGILKKSKTLDQSYEDDFYDKSITKDSPFGRVPSVSDNEMYRAEANGRRKRFRKKSRAKSTRSTIRSKSENSERGYESSGLMDSGFEPSPRVVQRRIMSPRLAAYYQQRNASGKYSAKANSRIPVRKPGDKNAVDMKSVTQRIQTNMRRYYCERKLFQHLLELKRLQIRTSKTNEAVLVKRAIDDYNKSSLASVGLGPYSSPDYTFSSFEKFLYDSLRKLQKSSKRQLENMPERPIDFDYGESELYKMSAVPDNPCLCTNKTHRCFHAVHAYTGIPCSAYIPHRWNHHTMPKPSTAGKSRGFLPKINSKPSSSKAHVTLEVSHGSEKQLIALPAEKLDKNKRYYVTFTVKGSEPPSDDNVSQKSVKSG